MATTSSRLVVIAGGSGFLGRGLARCLLERGYETTILSRSASPPADFPTGANWVCWDAESLGDWTACLDGAVAVVNFVGRSVDCRKTKENKRIILESRVKSCQVLGQAMNTVHRPPAIWIQSATAHIVGDPEPKDAICDESTPPGPMDEMAPRVGVAWELAFTEAKRDDQRGVILRISFVLGPHGGAMDRLRRITKLGLGGTVGSGDQWISWIHQDDLNLLVLRAIEDESFNGVYMVTAPESVTNRQFMRAMRRAYQRPWCPPAPAIGVRLACRFILNTDPELALLGRRCLPNRLLHEHNFQFGHPTLEHALNDLRQQESSL